MKLRPLWILLATWFVVIAYSFPGYMNFDSVEQLFEARSGNLNDWHPPIMAAYWAVLELVVHGPFAMLVLQTALFLWGLNAILCLHFAPRSAAVIAAVLMLFPPILTPMAVVWKDAQMAGFLLAGFALALRPRRRDRALGLFLLFLATAVRDNTVAALPPLCLYLCGAWGIGRKRVAVVVAAGVCIGLFVSSGFVNKGLTRTRWFPWYRSVAIMDIAGTICHAGPMSDAELTELLSGTGHVDGPHIQQKICSLYTPREWFELTDYWPVPTGKSERLARRDVWWRLIREHPIAFLEHRAAVMAEMLGLSSDQIWEPVCQTVAPNGTHGESIHHDFTLSWFQRMLGQFFVALGPTILYRPWAYAMLSLFFLGYAIARRNRFVLAMLGSGLLYETSYFFGAAARDYRYSHWMVVCCAIAAVTIFIERWRAGSARLSASSPSPRASVPPRSCDVTSPVA